MSSIRRSLARVDVRFAALVSGFAALGNAVLIASFALFAIVEGLEGEAAWLDRATDGLARAASDAAAGVATHEGVVVRVVPAGESGGAWPTAPALWTEANLEAVLSAGTDDFLVARKATRHGTLEAALPLAHFAAERAELVRGAAIVMALGTIASLGFGTLAARRALAPVRAMDAAMRTVTHRRLDARVPNRGTADDVDALARSINAVLTRLEWAFERLGGFSSDVAHELRTPINRILNEAQLALLGAPPDRQAGALSAIHETAERMGVLVNQMLLLASGEEGRLQTRRSPLALDTALAQLTDFYVPVAEGSGRRLELELPAHDAYWTCDRDLVLRALSNLIENAILHSETGAKIRVGIERTDGSLRVAVHDSGPGIPPAERERVFERFTRLDSARAGRGTGLGLPIARMIARLHGGDVAISESPLGGALCWMALPSSARSSDA